MEWGTSVGGYPVPYECPHVPAATAEADFGGWGKWAVEGRSDATENGNPSGAALPHHLPLHKGGFGSDQLLAVKGKCGTTENGNPSCAALPHHLPLHKGGFGSDQLLVVEREAHSTPDVGSCDDVREVWVSARSGRV